MTKSNARHQNVNLIAWKLNKINADKALYRIKI